MRVSVGVSVSQRATFNQVETAYKTD